MKESIHLMLDIETLSTQSNANILSIGAVYFSPKRNTLGKQFYVNIDPTTGDAIGLHTDPATVLWWMKRSEKARLSVMNNQESIENALIDFANFIGKRKVKVWGNGITFDNVILANAYNAADLPCPWKYYDSRDVRTIMEIDYNRAKREVSRTGTYHNALDDAITQAEWVMTAWNRLRL